MRIAGIPARQVQHTQFTSKYQEPRNLGKEAALRYIAPMQIRPTSRRFLLSRYILRAHAGPFLFSVTTLMFLFLLQFVMKFIDQLVGKGLTPWVITEFVALNLAWMLVLAVPMSVLVATLMAFGDLSSKHEVTAMKAGGMSLYRMLLPVVLTASVVAYGLVLFNNDVLPESNHRLKTLTIDIRRKKPTLTLNAGVFSQDIPGYSILVRKTFQNTNDLEGVTLFDHTNPNLIVTITAERGTISFSSDYRKLVMDLWNGEIHELDLAKISSYRRIRFATHRIVMDVQGFDFERSSESMFSRGDRELSAQAMEAIVDSLRGVKQGLARALRDMVTKEFDSRLTGRVDSATVMSGYQRAEPPVLVALNVSRRISASVLTFQQRIENVDRQIDQYLVEIYKKYSIPVACLVFVLVGAPLGIVARRGGFGIAATLSLGFFVLYWACLIGGEKLADRDILSPFLGMWSANIIIGLMGILLTVRIARETVVINWEFLQKYVPRRWRTRLEGEVAPEE
jgi:lipopolysaccharide export system permease protein